MTDAAVDPGLVAQQMQAQVLMIGERTLGTDVLRPAAASAPVPADGEPR